MRKKSFSYMTVCFFLILVPYIITVGINGSETALVNRVFDVEACIPAMMSQQIDSRYEGETLKAQAIIARTNFYRLLLQEKKLLEILHNTKYTLWDFISWWRIPWDIYEAAVSETEGQVLVHEGELKLVPYHEISSGVTRDGEETFHDSAYAYLKSVDSSADKNSPDYLNSTYISAQQMPSELNIKERDSAGHVQSLLADGNLLEGEAFRQGMGLASSDFSIQKVGNEFRFLCKGKGHGLGFSQYGGNELAKNGENAQEILAYYFPEMELAHVSGIFVKNE